MHSDIFISNKENKTKAKCSKLPALFPSTNPCERIFLQDFLPLLGFKEDVLALKKG